MEYLITQADEGRRLGDVVRSRLGVSYTALKSAKWNGRLLLNGAPARADARVREGELAAFILPQDEPVYRLAPCDAPLHVVYEDEWLLVVDKPAPLASQSSAGHPQDSLENIVFSYFGCPERFVYRPVNRLDKGTSGLMLIAKDGVSQHRLQSLLHTPAFERVYLAVTLGAPEDDAGTIDLPIAKEDAASVRRVIRPDGKPSVTHYEVLRRSGGLALVRLRLETGRTHQIRVHLSALGCPVFGDFLYGRESEALPGRFALHSHLLTLQHPMTGSCLTLTSPLPDCLRRLLD